MFVKFRTVSYGPPTEVRTRSRSRLERGAVPKHSARRYTGRPKPERPPVGAHSTDEEVEARAGGRLA